MDEEELIYQCNTKKNINSLIEVINSPECTKDVINFIDKSGRTPLFMACISNNYKIVEALIKKGADPNLSKDNKEPPLQTAIFRGKISAASPKDIEDNSKIIKLLIDAKADVNFKGEYSPFISACMSENIEAIKILLSYDVDVFYKDMHGKTGMDYLIENDNKDGIRLVENYILKNNLEFELSNKNNQIKKPKV